MIRPEAIRKQRIIMLLLAILIVVTVIVSMRLGFSNLPFNRLLPTLLGDGTFKEHFILFDVRLPRIFITLLGGMALALSGSVLQSVTKNDLADPGIIGINAGAGVGVALFFLFMPIDATTFAYVLPMVAFGGAFISSILIYLFSYKRHAGLQPVRLVLTGVGFSMALNGVMIVLISSADREKVDFISKWLAGNVWGTDWPFIWALLPWLVVLVPFVLYKSHKLNLLSLDDSVAIGVGVSLNKERLVLLLAAVALAAAAVSVTGGIAFIGLMAPHIAKALVGPRSQLFVPVSVLIGGWLLVLADTIGRNIPNAEGVPAGIVVALIGAPYFVYLLLKKVR